MATASLRPARAAQTPLGQPGTDTASPPSRRVTARGLTPPSGLGANFNLICVGSSLSFRSGPADSREGRLSSNERPGGRARPRWLLRLGRTGELPGAAGADGARIDACRCGVSEPEFHSATEQTLLPLARLPGLYFESPVGGLLGLTYKHAKGL